jgi:ADP-heptose:LPS heptosyltransferase
VSEIFVDSIKPWVGEIEGRPFPRVHLHPEDRLSGETWLCQQGWTPGRFLIAVHPGAGSAAKRWPAGRFQSLVDQIVEVSKAGVVVIAGPAESGLARRVAGNLPGVNIAESLPLGLAAGALSLCQAFIGNDSGIAHLAAGLGLPSVVLFGATAPEHWAPRGSQVMVLRNTRECRPCETGSDEEHVCRAT